MINSILPVTNAINHNQYHYQNQYRLQHGSSMSQLSTVSSLPKALIFVNGFYGQTAHIERCRQPQQQQQHQQQLQLQRRLSNQHYRLINNDIPFYSNYYYVYVPLIGSPSAAAAVTIPETIAATATLSSTATPLSMVGFIRGQYRYNMSHIYR